jgi:hypothetical protein
MEVRNNGTRFSEYYKWEDVKYTPYDYTKYGLLTRIMSNYVLNTTNPALKVVLEYVESSLLFVMKYTDILKNFKNIHWKNR